MLAAHPSLRDLSAWARAPGVKPFLERAARHPWIPAPARRLAELLSEVGSKRSADGQLVFYGAEPNFHDAFSLKNGLYGPAMRSLGAENAFLPTEIGPRTHDRIPAAVIRLLFDTWLTSNCLSLGDRVSMSVGVETRLPFLDVGLIERVMAFRTRHPDHRLGQKAWLRAALKGVLPDEVLARPKAGFQPPVQAWLSGVIATYGAALRDGRLVDSGIINAARVDDVLTKLPARGWPGLFFAYKLVLLELWVRQVVEA
jgi:asparagine synthase (glutamine-hydrolysing)